MKTSSNMNITACAAAAVLVVVLLLGEANLSVAVVCNPAALSPCRSAISSNLPPPPACCIAIKQQKPCLCQYLKDPAVGKLINTPAAKKVASACGVAIPKC